MTEKWNDVSIKDKFRLVESSVLFGAAIILYFLSFIITSTIGMGIVSAGLTLLATGAALIGVSMATHTAIMDMRSEVNNELNMSKEDLKRFVQQQINQKDRTFGKGK